MISSWSRGSRVEWVVVVQWVSLLLTKGRGEAGWMPPHSGSQKAKNTLCQEGQIYKNLFWMTSRASSSAFLHIYPIMLTSSYSRPHNRRIMSQLLGREVTNSAFSWPQTTLKQLEEWHVIVSCDQWETWDFSSSSYTTLTGHLALDTTVRVWMAEG